MPNYEDGDERKLENNNAVGVIGFLANLLANPNDDRLAEVAIIPKDAVVDLALAMSVADIRRDIHIIEARAYKQKEETGRKDKIGTKTVDPNDEEWVALIPFMDDDDVIFEDTGGDEVLPYFDDILIRNLLKLTRGKDGALTKSLERLAEAEMVTLEQPETMTGYGD